MITIDKDGTMYLYQGDSGEVVVTGLDDSLSWTTYFAIQDAERNPIGEELQVSAINTDTVSFILTSEFTNLLTVPKNQPYQIYFYGIKVCEAGGVNEDTLFVDGSTYGDLNLIVVFPEKVKGAKNSINSAGDTTPPSTTTQPTTTTPTTTVIEGGNNNG